MTIPLDKQAHLLAGAAIALAAGYFFPVWIALTFAVGVGALKEIYDSYHPKNHTVDIKDFWWTAFGGCLGCFIILVASELR